LSSATKSAAAFVASGVDVPVRDIAAKAGVGLGTIYRHFPTRADLVVAVYRRQVEACAEAGPALLANSSTPHAALARWINLFVDFLVTKHGLAKALQSDDAAFETLHAYFLDRLVPCAPGCLLANSSTPHAALARWINLFVDFLVTKHGLAKALQSDDAAFETLHAYFLDRLVPVCARLLDAAAEAGEILPGMDAYELMLGVGNLCIGADNNPRYDARRIVELVIAGLRLH
jgi:AcrR family transcriptional regulator